MNNIKHPPILYLFIYKVIKARANGKPFITYDCAVDTLKRRLYKIPANIRYMFLVELEELKLLRRIGKRNNMRFELIGKDIDKLINRYNPIF